MSEETVLQALRQQAWERAKGELNSILCAAYSRTEDEAKRAREFDRVTKEYIKTVDDYGLSE